MLENEQRKEPDGIERLGWLMWSGCYWNKIERYSAIAFGLSLFQKGVISPPFLVNLLYSAMGHAKAQMSMSTWRGKIKWAWRVYWCALKMNAPLRKMQKAGYGHFTSEELDVASSAVYICASIPWILNPRRLGRRSVAWDILLIAIDKAKDELGKAISIQLNGELGGEVMEKAMQAKQKAFASEALLFAKAALWCLERGHVQLACEYDQSVTDRIHLIEEPGMRIRLFRSHGRFMAMRGEMEAAERSLILAYSLAQDHNLGDQMVKCLAEIRDLIGPDVDVERV